MPSVTTGFTSTVVSVLATKQGSSAAIHTIVTDNSTSTYVSLDGNTGVGGFGSLSAWGGLLGFIRLRVELPGPSDIPGLADGSARITRARIEGTEIRADSGIATGSFVLSQPGKAPMQFPQWQINSSAGWITRRSPWVTALPGGARLLSERPFGKTWNTVIARAEPVDAAIGVYYTGSGASDLDVAEMAMLWRWEGVGVVSNPTPSGTLKTTTPIFTVDWSDPNPDGPAKDPIAMQVLIFEDDVAAAPDFDPATSKRVALLGRDAWWLDDGTLTMRSSLAGMEPLSNGDYVAYIRAAKDFNGSRWWSAWVSTSFTVAVPPPPTPTVTLTPLTSSQSMLVEVTAPVNALHSWLSSGTYPGVPGKMMLDSTNTTSIGNFISVGHDWTGNDISIAVEAAGAADVTLSPSTTYWDMLPVEEGDIVAAGFTSKNDDGSPCDVRTVIQFFDANGDPLSTIDGTPVTQNDWTVAAATGAAPQDAVAALPIFEIQSADTGQAFLIDGLFMYRHSTSTNWSPGAGPTTWDHWFAGESVTKVLVERNIDLGGGTVDPDAWQRVAELPLDTHNPTVDFVDTLAPRGVDLVYRAFSTIDNNGPSEAFQSLTSATAEVADASAISAPGQDEAEIPPDGKWWLKAPFDPGLSTPVRAREGTVTEDRPEAVGVFEPIGRALPVVVTGDQRGRPGALLVSAIGTDEERAAVEAILTHPGKLYSQDTDGGEKWIRITHRAVAKRNPTDNRIHDWQVTYVEVEPADVVHE